MGTTSVLDRSSEMSTSHMPHNVRPESCKPDADESMVDGTVGALFPSEHAQAERSIIRITGTGKIRCIEIS
jgi:hypothetical protein